MRFQWVSSWYAPSLSSSSALRKLSNRLSPIFPSTPTWTGNLLAKSEAKPEKRSVGHALCYRFNKIFNNYLSRIICASLSGEPFSLAIWLVITCLNFVATPPSHAFTRVTNQLGQQGLI